MRWQNTRYLSNRKLINAVLLLGALASSWLAFQVSFYQTLEATIDKHQSDAFMEDVHALEFNEQGGIEAEFFAKKMLHYPVDNITAMDMPCFIIHVQGRSPWKITAINGKAYEGIKRVALWDQVKGHTPKGVNNVETSIQTQSVMIFPANKYAETSQQVTAQQPGITVTSTGAQVDLNKHTIKLLENVRGEYVPAH